MEPMSTLKQRRLGRTELMVTELGLGAMDTPTSPEGPATVARAVELGITFIDTAREYAGSEFLLGQYIREHGVGGLQIGTKSFSRTANGVQREVDRSLSVLGVESVALYQLHDVTTPEAWEQVMREDEGALAGLKVARYRRLIGHIGISSHSLDVIEKAITCGEFGAVMLEYSAFFPQTASLIDLAARCDVGVIVMRPLGGSGRTSVIRGMLDDGSAGILTPANLLRYVLSNPGVSVAIPGARYPRRIEENVATAFHYEPMAPAEQRAIEEAAASLY
jgi:aryl-alcohol dehydrogenase-like predicted oxidoreductase